MEWRPGYMWKDFGFATLRRPLKVGDGLVRIKLKYETLRQFNAIDPGATIDHKLELEKIDPFVIAAAKTRLSGMTKATLPDFLTITLDDLEREK